MLKISLCTLTTFIGTSAFGHVFLMAPTGNDELEVGSTYEITWQITIPHDTENWDLYYSNTSQNGKWIPIAIDLPLGDNSQNSIHTYDWVVPDMPSDTVWVRVVMDNTGGDYDDTNDLPFSIVAPAACVGDINDDGDVGVTDLLAVIDAWGQQKSDADVNGDGIVNVSDVLAIVGNWGLCD